MGNMVKNVVGVHMDKSNSWSRFNYRTWQLCSEGTFSLDRWIKIPDGLTHDEASKWHGENWGTHEIDLQHYVDMKDVAIIDFHSSWCPPTVAMITISKMFPKLTFMMKSRYMEQPTSIGTDLEEEYTIINGKVIHFTSTDPNDEQW